MRGPTARRLAQAGLVAAAAGAGVVLGAGLGGVAESLHRPLPAYLGLGLAVCWSALQALALWTAFGRDRRRFAFHSWAMVFVGLALMAFGRGGLGGLFSVGFLAAAASGCLASVAMGLWVSTRSEQTQTMWRLFFWQCLVGLVYLFSVHPAEALAQAVALSATVGVCALLFVLQPGMVAAVLWLERADPRRVSAAAWGCGLVLLTINVTMMRLAGARTPQVWIGVLPAAPYFMAAAVLTFAVALDLRTSLTRGWRALMPGAAGLGIAAAMYGVGLQEFGTLLLVGLAVVVAVLIAGSTRQAVAAAVAVVTLGNIARLSWLPDALALVSTRAGERLAAWTGQVDSPDQIVRVLEVGEASGLLGGAGAARLQVIVGSQVTKDYMSAVLLAHGGWFGLALACVAVLALVLELYRLQKRHTGAVAVSLQAAVVAMVVGNLLVTTLWMGGILPFTGMPLPLLARGGSHLMVFALLLLVVEAINQGRPAPVEVRHAS